MSEVLSDIISMDKLSHHMLQGLSRLLQELVELVVMEEMVGQEQRVSSVEPVQLVVLVELGEHPTEVD